MLVVGNTDRTTLTHAQQQQLKVGSDASLATDTMMIVHLPANNAAADLISLPRDSYVDIPGYGMNKLNAAYVDGYVNTPGSLDAKRTAGASLLIKTVTNLTGLRIDHYVGISLLGFVQISSAIGGVDINLCHSVNDTVAANRAAGSNGGSGLVLSAGPHTISGVTALEFVRQRHGLPNGDLDRTARQRYFITQAFHQIASAGVLLDPGKLNGLVSAIDKAIFVDGGLDLLSVAQQMGNLNPANIVGKAIPFVHYATTDVGSVEIVDRAEVQHFINNSFTPLRQHRPLRTRPAPPRRRMPQFRSRHAQRRTASTSGQNLEGLDAWTYQALLVAFNVRPGLELAQVQRPIMPRLFSERDDL